MTQWVEETEGGRGRGPVGMLRAWIEVLVRPRRFFRTRVRPADQGPGLVFAMLVVLVAESARILLVDAPYPVFSGELGLPPVLGLALVVILVTPLALHLVAAIQTVVLVALVRDRGGVSETVQVLAYAAAPCALSGVPIPELRVACTTYGAILLAIGTAEVHRISFRRAVVVSLLPAAIVFGYGFRGFAAVETLLRNWYII